MSDELNVVSDKLLEKVELFIAEAWVLVQGKMELISSKGVQLTMPILMANTMDDMNDLMDKHFAEGEGREVTQAITINSILSVMHLSGSIERSKKEGDEPTPTPGE